MKKNGFTLVEMLTVIVILVTLGLIAVFSINGIVKTSSDELYNMQIASVIDAGRTYAIEKSDQLSDYNQITLCDLKIKGLLDENFVNPKTEEKFDDSLIIEINKNDLGEYDVRFDAVTKMVGYYCDLNAISVKLNGNSPYYVSYGNTYTDPGISVEKENASGDMVSYNNYTLEKSGNYETAIQNGTFNKIGTYIETYTVTDKSTNFKTSVTRTIVIEDNTAPNISFNASSNPTIIIAGDNFNVPSCQVSDNYDNNPKCEVKSNYSQNVKPGTYEVVYSAKDSSGNTNTKTLTIIVREKNKKLLGKLTMDTLAWSNTGVSVSIAPLYNETTCNSFIYSFDGYSWGTSNTKTITENGNYTFAIKYNAELCTDINALTENGTIIEDKFTYKFTNIDKEKPTFLVKNPNTNMYENKASLLIASSSGNAIYTETLTETIDGESVERKYYYINESVNISGASGAHDGLSGISHYVLYVNDIEQTEPNFSLNDVGKYTIKMKAVDHAMNESDVIEVATIILDMEPPVCSFVTCANPTQCNNNPAIYGANVSYVAAKTSFQVILDSNEYQNVKFKLTCADNYYEGKEDYFRNINIPLNYFDVDGEHGEGLSSIVSRELTNTSVECNSGLCTRTYNYIIGVNVGKAETYNNDPIMIRIKPGAVLDKAGNSNTDYNYSMSLAKMR